MLSLSCNILAPRSQDLGRPNLGGEMLVSSMGRNMSADILLAESPLQIQLEQYNACTTLMSKLSLPAVG